MEPVKIMKMKPGEESEISNLAISVFNRFVGPEFGEQGRETFFSHAEPGRILDGFESGNLILVAKFDSKITGVMEIIVDRAHIAMLFVDSAFHGRGIARMLWKKARESMLSRHPSILKFTVNSSTFAVPVYEKLGFAACEEKKMKGGMVFTPMEMIVDRED